MNLSIQRVGNNKKMLASEELYRAYIKQYVKELGAVCSNIEGKSDMTIEAKRQEFVSQVCLEAIRNLQRILYKDRIVEILGDPDLHRMVEFASKHY